MLGIRNRRLVSAFLALCSYCLIIVLVVLMCMPVYWLFSSSFKPPQQLFSTPPTFVPSPPTTVHYRTVFASNFLTELRNSLFVAAATTMGSLVVTSLAAYGLSRFRFRGRTLVSFLIIASQMLPGVLLLIPLFVVFSRLNLVNSHLGLAVAYTTFTIPFATWMLKGYFDSLPTELEEAGMVDGCTRLSAFLRVLLPAALPGVSAVALYALLLSWNELIMASVLTRTPGLFTVPVALNVFSAPDAEWWMGPMMAKSVLFVLPVMVIFLYLQRFLVSGLTAGAVKG